MEIIVGRKGNQAFPITDKSVSGKHLKLTTLPNGNVQIEDLGSSNGTFIDGIRIIKKEVGPNTVIQLGQTLLFRISDALPKVAPPSVGGNANPQTSQTAEYDPEILMKFQQLEAVWNKYQTDSIRLQRNNASKGFMRMLPMVLLGGFGYLLSLVPGFAGFRIAITLLGIGVGVIITWISYKSATSLPEQMAKLNQQFQIDYVCPKCKQFLGFTPYQGLINRGQCSACKTKWVRK